MHDFGDRASVSRAVLGQRGEALSGETHERGVRTAGVQPRVGVLQPTLGGLDEGVLARSGVGRLARQDLAQDRAQAKTSERSSRCSTWPSACSGGM